METTADTKNKTMLFDRENSQLQNTIFSVQSPPLAMHFHQWWTRACMLCLSKSSADVTHCFTAAITASLLKHTTHRLAVLTSTVWSPSTFRKHCWMSIGAVFFFQGGIQWHAFISSPLPWPPPFCQTAPLLPSVTWKQTVTEYWWEGSTFIAICLSHCGPTL